VALHRKCLLIPVLQCALTSSLPACFEAKTSGCHVRCTEISPELKMQESYSNSQKTQQVFNEKKVSGFGFQFFVSDNISGGALGLFGPTSSGPAPKPLDDLCSSFHWKLG